MSWKELYRMSPCVPVDYPTIAAAMELAQDTSSSSQRWLAARSSNATHSLVQTRSLRVLLRPHMVYKIKEAIVVCAPPGVKVSMETIQLSASCLSSRTNMLSERAMAASSTTTTTTTVAPPSKKRIRWNCKSGTRDQVVLSLSPSEDSNQNSEHSFSSLSEEAMDDLAATGSSPAASSLSLESSDSMAESNTLQTATIILKTRRQNEPVFLVQQGSLYLQGLSILHSSHGMDIWNGNAAILPMSCHCHCVACSSAASHHGRAVALCAWMAAICKWTRAPLSSARPRVCTLGGRAVGPG